jgi:hypothetical protein
MYQVLGSVFQTIPQGSFEYNQVKRMKLGGDLERPDRWYI